MSKKVRVRFAPSPTGGLHLGGVRTVLFNYLFARHHGGEFVLRIEDTDQSRFVSGAEEYILETLRWCGLEPDEGPHKGGPYAPYRQSERKPLYHQYAIQLVQQGNAYYAFDTQEELETKRSEIANFQYNHITRQLLKNSLTLSVEEVQRMLNDNTPYVIRIKMPVDEEVSITDMIREEVCFNTSQVDDKVLLKADGMPTYHLAVVVDDYLMKITHAFRGEEWLPSAPVHILLWRYLGWEKDMPQWAHLPLILKPDGNGKLSKRDGERLGFPVFAMNWQDRRTNEHTQGFRERGFLPQAFVNMLAMLGWNDGTSKEIFTLSELVARFSMDRVHKGGAKFDYEKAKWFNQEWIKQLPVSDYRLLVKDILAKAGIVINDDEKLTKIIDLVKERCVLLSDFVQQAGFFFQRPTEIDTDTIMTKWDDKKAVFFTELADALNSTTMWQHDELEKIFKKLAATQQLKPGELMLPLRIMLVGGKFGPDVFEIAAIIGKEETIARIEACLKFILEHRSL